MYRYLAPSCRPSSTLPSSPVGRGPQTEAPLRSPGPGPQLPARRIAVSPLIFLVALWLWWAVMVALVSCWWWVLLRCCGAVLQLGGGQQSVNRERWWAGRVLCLPACLPVLLSLRPAANTPPPSKEGLLRPVRHHHHSPNSSLSASFLHLPKTLSRTLLPLFFPISSSSSSLAIGKLHLVHSPLLFFFLAASSSLGC